MDGSVTIVVRESSGNVKFSYSGTLDLSELSFTIDDTVDVHRIQSNALTGDSFVNAFPTTGGGSLYESPFSSAPSDWFTPSSSIEADMVSGNQLAIFTPTSNSTERLRVHTRDVSGTIWSGSGIMRFDSTTISEMGLDLSTDRVWTINNAAADTITMTAVPEIAVSEPKITSFRLLEIGGFELVVSGESNTVYELRSSPTLEFNPGALVENLMQGDLDDLGTIGGINRSLVTTDEQGMARIRMALTESRNFVRAQCVE